MSDPMADFLAREKAALGDDAQLFATHTDTMPPVHAPSPVDAFPALDSQPRLDVRVTADDDVAQFTSAFPDLSGEVATEPSTKPVFDALSPQPYGSSPYPPTTTAPPPRSVLPAPAFTNILSSTDDDTEPIKAWRAQQADQIKARDDADKKKREEITNAAENAMDAFYDGYNKMKERNIRENKENEAEFLTAIQESTAKGTSWERITNLIHLENSQSKTIRPSVVGHGGSDLARMKEVLLGLRREGEKAPGAAGF